MSAPDDAALPFRDGEIIAGKYEMDRVLGQGGMGVVVAAHHVTLGQKVAIKFLLPSAMSIPGAAARFLREARSAAAIQSEHVARVLDVGTLENGAPFMVMEYLTGSDLGRVLQREGRLPVGLALDYVLQACEAIAEAHSLGIVHRDLKPDNVFLTRRADGSALVKVLDFGLSKPTKEETRGAATPSLTSTNMVAGSPQYMSPEQVRSLKGVDHRTDVWALGVILYELLAGQRPFEAESVAAVFAKIAADAPAPPRALRPDLPDALQAAILRCLEKDMSRRVQSVAELARLLEPYAPAEARTSIARIVRLGGASAGAGVSAPPAGGDALEADIPTMAAPAMSAPTMTASGPARAAPPAQTAPATPVRSRAAAPAPVAEIELAPRPALTSEPRWLSSDEMDVDRRGRPMHPAERGRGAQRGGEEEPRAPLGELKLGGPLRLLGIAIAIAAADMVARRVLGQELTLGPVRPLWVAGPLALGGAVWLVLRVIYR